MFKFEKWTCCFGCTLPIDICRSEDATNWKVKCHLHWRVQTMCLLWWWDKDMRAQLESQLGESLPTDRIRYAEYLSTRAHFRGLFAHGAFLVSWSIVQMHPPYRDGDGLSDLGSEGSGDIGDGEVE